MITEDCGNICFGKVYNTRPETFYGLAEWGFNFTTTGGLSKIKRLGKKIAESNSERVIESQRSVVEGYKTLYAAHKLAVKYDIRARIFKGIYEVYIKTPMLKVLSSSS